MLFFEAILCLHGSLLIDGCPDSTSSIKLLSWSILSYTTHSNILNIPTSLHHIFSACLYKLSAQFDVSVGMDLDPHRWHWAGSTRKPRSETAGMGDIRTFLRPSKLGSWWLDISKFAFHFISQNSHLISLSYPILRNLHISHFLGVTSPPFSRISTHRAQPCPAARCSRQEEAERAHRAEVRLDQTISELRKVQLSCEETGDAWGPWGPWGPPGGWESSWYILQRVSKCN